MTTPSPGITPGLSHKTCGECEQVTTFQMGPLCIKYDKRLSKNEDGAPIRCHDCRADARGELND